MYKVLNWVMLLSVLSTHQNESLEGTWMAEKDSKSKWVFTNDGKCKRYYDNELLNTYVYSLSNTSPQCDKTVPVNSKTQYLKLVKVGKVDSEYCYEVNGITAEKLSLRQIGTGSLLLFDKQ
ncbi:hypothetical protein [Roseivirga sp. 4D4]|uniref:hypothetical protein n=1 Tax=Roseivirga sp. 4D4 TaxID=1889784 RepID=UPI001112D225|nr:hypothetical protein [Roseivirga sp. 4D4]